MFLSTVKLMPFEFLAASNPMMEQRKYLLVKCWVDFVVISQKVKNELNSTQLLIMTNEQNTIKKSHTTKWNND